MLKYKVATILVTTIFISSTLLFISFSKKSDNPLVDVHEVKILDGNFYVGMVFGSYDYGKHANVKVKRFFIMDSEVTIQLYESVFRLASKKYNLKMLCAETDQDSCALTGTENSNQPVGGISWIAAAVFSNALSEVNGFKPVYYYDNSVLRDSSVEPKHSVGIDLTANGYRLPSITEWEVAARGGAPGIEEGTYGNHHSGGENADEVAWVGANSNGHTWPARGKRPNQLGIYDMSGNVSEWTNTKIDLGSSDAITDFYMYCGENFESSSGSNLNSCDFHSGLISDAEIGFRLARNAP